MAPQKLPLEITWTEDQLNYLKSKMSQNKGWKLNWKKSSKWQPTLPNTKTDLNHWTTKVRQTSNIQPSQNHIKSLKVNNETMQDVSKSMGSNYRADKPAQQSNDQQQQGRQPDRQPPQSQS